MDWSIDWLIEHVMPIFFSTTFLLLQPLKQYHNQGNRSHRARKSPRNGIIRGPFPRRAIVPCLIGGQIFCPLDSRPKRLPAFPLPCPQRTRQSTWLPHKSSITAIVKWRSTCRTSSPGHSGGLFDTPMPAAIPTGLPMYILPLQRGKKRRRLSGIRRRFENARRKSNCGQKKTNF